MPHLTIPGRVEKLEKVQHCGAATLGDGKESYPNPGGSEHCWCVSWFVGLVDCSK